MHLYELNEIPSRRSTYIMDTSFEVRFRQDGGHTVVVYMQLCLKWILKHSAVNRLVAITHLLTCKKLHLQISR